jgi:hypothetical protein
VQHFDLRSTQLGQAGLDAVFTGLRHNTTLTSLNLEDANLGLTGASSLVEWMKSNTAIKELVFSYVALCRCMPC